MSGEGGGMDAATGWGYRPHLDGLRAVAVTLVVAFHSSVDRAAGGYVGVDVFFVLSGYLVTGVLLRAVESEGRVPLRTFYARRVRRLLPAAAVNLVVTAVVFAVIAAPAELEAARRSIASAALYVSNWFFISEATDYFGSDVESSPVAHYWSLSVEEQFYLLWPLLLGGLIAAAHRLGRGVGAVRVAVGIGLLASLVAALAIAGGNLSRAYYGTDTRAYQLLAGALLALSPGLLRRVGAVGPVARALPWVAVAAGGALLLVATDLVEVGPVSRGAVTTVVVAVLLISLEAVDRGPVRAVLSWSPLTYLGKISYGTYLWHWIVVLVVTRTYELSGLGTFAVVLPVATGLASLSYQLLEQPVRLARVLDRPRLAVIGTGLVVSLVVGIVVAPRILDEPDRPSAAATIDAGGTPNDADWGAAFGDFYDFEECPSGRGVTCRVVEGDGPSVLLVGDSHAGMLTPMVEDVAARRDLDLSVGFLDYCPWTWGTAYQGVGQTCLEEQRTLFEESIPDLDPDVVILVHRPVDDPAEPLGVRGEAGKVPDARRADALRDSVGRVVSSLREDGRQVVVIEPIPVTHPDSDPLTCLSEAEVLEECRFVASSGPLGEERALRELAARDDGVHLLDLDRVVCPYLPICDPVVDGMVVRRDNNHLTVSYGREVVAEPFETFLEESGVLS